MFPNLAPGVVGLKVSFLEGLDLARAAGFEGADLQIDAAVDLDGREGAGAVREAYGSRGLRPGGWALPDIWRGSDAVFLDGLKNLENQARVAGEAGCFRCCTWVPSWHDSLSRTDYWKQAVHRFREIARVLQGHGCRLGLEFLGPRTLRAGRAHGFIHTLDGMLALCDATGQQNVGLLFDLWHWYTSRGTLDDLRQLSGDQVVYLHVNDAPAGVDPLDQVDNRRCLPGATGVIPARELIGILREIGYDGPVTAEPFNAEINELAASDPLAAARRVRESLATIL